MLSAPLKIQYSDFNTPRVLRTLKQLYAPIALFGWAVGGGGGQFEKRYVMLFL